MSIFCSRGAPVDVMNENPLSQPTLILSNRDYQSSKALEHQDTPPPPLLKNFSHPICPLPPWCSPSLLLCPLSVKCPLLSRNPRMEDTSKGRGGGITLEANLKSISHRRYLREVAFEWELIKKNIHLPLGCLQGDGSRFLVRQSADKIEISQPSSSDAHRHGRVRV